MLLRHDIAPPAMTIVATPIPAEQSICLRFIRAGAIAQIGSTASSSWMNVGFTIPEFFHRARSVGEALRTSLNMHIARENIRAFRVLDFEIGKPSPQFLGPDRNPGHVQSISRVVLIGDPAYRPQPEPVPFKELPQVVARPHPMGEPADPPRVPELPADLASLDEMIDALDRDIDDHFVTLNRVINVGKPAVEPLRKRLESTRAWQVPKALGAIRDARAIDPLIDALERGPQFPFSDAVVEALESITGAKAGTTARQWRAWREKGTP